MPDLTVDRLLAGAREALDRNRLYGLTVPHRQMFPAAYLWDTCVTAKGIACFDPRRAADEVGRFLQSQWHSGMLPNEVYFERIGVRHRLFGHHPHRPDGLTTSGITQPPMIVRTVLEVGRRLERDERDRFYRDALPAMVSLARWVLTRRLGHRGLAVVVHPYETGMDNRIDLATALEREWLADGAVAARLVRAAELGLIGAARRVVGDVRRVPVAQRSSDVDVLAAYLQTRHIRRLGYDLVAVRDSGRGVLIEDVGFNAVLLDAFECLAELVAEVGGPAGTGDWVDGELRPATERLAAAVEGLWSQGTAGLRPGYHSRDHRSGALLPYPTVAGLFPLLRGRDRTRIRVLLDALTDPRQYGTPVGPPSAPADSAGFEPERYWRGAAWSFPLDIVETALRLRGEQEIAAELRDRYLRRPHAAVHAEYENPLTGRPLGARPFSPAAALAIRLATGAG